MTFPTVKPLAPWEATALLHNTAIAAGIPNTAKLDRLTYLESVVANLLLGQPATLGLAALPPVKHATVSLGMRPGGLQAGDLTDAHIVIAVFVDDESDALPTAFIATLKTRTGAELVGDLPHAKPGDAWLVLIINESSGPFSLEPAAGIIGHPDAVVPPGAGQLFLLTVVSMTVVLFTPLLAGATAAVPAVP